MRPRPSAYRVAVAVTGMLALWTAALPAVAVASPRAAAPTAYRLVHVDPCATDPAMTCDARPLTGVHIPHDVYVPARPPARPRLAVFFPGTGARPAYYAPVAQALASTGWYVIVLRYVATTATENACPATPSPANVQCYRQFRAETVFGENVPDPTGHAYNYTGGHIARADSVMNRLLKLVAYLAVHPALAGPGWAGFQAQQQGRCRSFNSTYDACGLDWSRIALGGHSQGAGVALYLAKFYLVARVALFSGPEDADPLAGRTVVAPWIAEGHFATPVARIYGFTHQHDPFYARQTASWTALRLPGPLTAYAPGHPFDGRHRLVTSLSPGCPQLGTALAAHSATTVVGCAALPAYAAVWTYMYGPPS